jgi:hypothetical protein
MGPADLPAASALLLTLHLLADVGGILFPSMTRWKWSRTILACGSARRIPDVQGADGSIATTATPSRNSVLCKDIQPSTHAPERPERAR